MFNWTVTDKSANAKHSANACVLVQTCSFGDDKVLLAQAHINTTEGRETASLNIYDHCGIIARTMGSDTRYPVVFDFDVSISNRTGLPDLNEVDAILNTLTEFKAKVLELFPGHAQA